MLVVKIGGPAYRIGMGGGAASSVPSGSRGKAELDFNAVQVRTLLCVGDAVQRMSGICSFARVDNTEASRRRRRSKSWACSRSICPVTKMVRPS